MTVAACSILHQQAFSYLQSTQKLSKFFHSIVQNVQVFARVAPKQKVQQSASHNKAGCVRLTLFRNRNTYNDEKKSLARDFWSYWTTKWLLNYLASAKVGRNVFSNLLKNKFNSYSTYSYSEIRSIGRNLKMLF